MDLGAVVNMAVADPKALEKAAKEQPAADQSSNGSGAFVTEKWW